MSLLFEYKTLNCWLNKLNKIQNFVYSSQLIHFSLYNGQWCIIFATFYRSKSTLHLKMS